MWNICRIVTDVRTKLLCGNPFKCNFVNHIYLTRTAQ